MAFRENTAQYDDIQAIAGFLAIGYLRHVRGPACQAAEKGSTRARKGLDDVAPRGRVSPGQASPRDGGSSHGS